MSQHQAEPTAEGVAALRKVAHRLDPGLVPEAAALGVVTALRGAWGALADGDVTGMTADKLDRVETLWWDPPQLSFRIERHGRTVGGSSRADIHQWVVDVDAATAAATSAGYRQLTPNAPGWDPSGPAAEVAEAIRADRDDSRLRWGQDRQRVQVLTRRIVPPGPMATTQGRSIRFNKALRARLEGWEPAPGGWWRRQ